MSGPQMHGLRLIQARQAAGPWLDGFEPPRPIADWGHAEAQVAIYLITDRDGRLCYCGQSAREGQRTAVRLREHLRDASKREQFASFSVLRLREHTPAAVVSAIEGRIADVLGLRGAFQGRRWPSSQRWFELVGSVQAEHAARGWLPRPAYLSLFGEQRSQRYVPLAAKQEGGAGSEGTLAGQALEGDKDSGAERAKSSGGR